MIPTQLLPLANHLWQSTLFAAAAGLLTLVLRKNRAQVRYGLWFAASVKFLVPFSVLVDAGSHFGGHTAPAIAESSLSVAIERAGEPFVSPGPLFGTPAPAPPLSENVLPAALYGIWAIGSMTLISAWWVRWRSLSAALRMASPLELPVDLKAMTSPAFAEPGVFGIRRPVLLLPAGITSHLTPPQWKAILAHELCHIRRRDNLVTAVHMAVEAVFWFYPLVWWLGARMMDQRERACDEEVLLQGSDPATYAEAILKICELYLASPLPCVSGVTGANLKKRIEAIMSNRIVLKLNFAKKAALVMAAVASLAGPVAVGVSSAPLLRAESPQVLTPSAVGPVPKFEVASIKPCKAGEENGGGKRGGSGGRTHWSPARLTVECATVAYFIRDAYLRYGAGKPWAAATRGEDPSTGNLASHGVPPISDRLVQQPIKGSPSWVDSDRYTIDVKAEDAAVSQERMRGPMMQALLEERFKLKIHRESREIPVYELTVARGGAKLQPSKEGSCIARFSPQDREAAPGQPFPRLCGMFSPGQGGGTDVPGTTIGNLCRQFSVTLDRDVIDKTGLMGMFDIHLDTHPSPPPPDVVPPPKDPSDPGPPSAAERAWYQAEDLVQFRSAVQKLGLRLEPAKGLGVYLVVESVERPSEN